jgi:predicted 3-demethylubiquinone-9 3-methyltransferase (glyoxalase superfamily)
MVIKPKQLNTNFASDSAQNLKKNINTPQFLIKKTFRFVLTAHVINRLTFARSLPVFTSCNEHNQIERLSGNLLEQKDILI